jgi:hypothetical protein
MDMNEKSGAALAGFLYNRNFLRMFNQVDENVLKQVFHVFLLESAGLVGHELLF